MAELQESPTKQIREKLRDLQLNEGHNAQKRDSIKNHLQIPKLILNQDFNDENVPPSPVNGDTTTFDGQDTVIHNINDPNTTLPDWMKVKIEMRSKKSSFSNGESTKVASHSLLKPKLLSSSEQDDDDHNQTWEQLKKDYNINDEDLYTNQDYNDQTSDISSTQLNQSIFSFQDMPKLGIQTQGSTIHTAKVTSFKSNFIDSPLAPPKLMKSIRTDTLADPLKLQEQNIKVPVKLITPESVDMIFDKEEGKWVYPKDTINITNSEVTSVTNLELSFSESKKALVSALTDVLKPNSNWDDVREVDLTDKNLVTLAGIEDFTPNLKKINLTNNKLTSFEGLSTELENINLSYNSLCNHLTDVHKFSKLLTLDLRSNKISDMSLFAELTSLRELNLSNNKISKIVSLPNIMSLNLSNNRLDGELDFSEFDFDWLWNLDLSGNKIESIKNLQLSEILSLSVRNNRLENFEITSPSKLKKLDILSNMMSQFNPGDHLKSLTILSMDGFTKINGVFPSLHNLTIKKDVGFTCLINEKFQVNPHLLTLSYTESQLTHNDYGLILTKFPLLQNLDLSSNLIGGSFVELLEFLQTYKFLKTFNVDSNPLVEHLKTEQDKLEFKVMIQKILANE